MTFQKLSRLGTLLASRPVPVRLLLKESKLISTYEIKNKLNIFYSHLERPREEGEGEGGREERGKGDRCFRLYSCRIWVYLDVEESSISLCGLSKSVFWLGVDQMHISDLKKLTFSACWFESVQFDEKG